MTVRSLKAPFPYFGGKSAVAPLVWSRFGRVKNYVEPFFGSGRGFEKRRYVMRIDPVAKRRAKQYGRATVSVTIDSRTCGGSKFEISGDISAEQAEALHDFVEKLFGAEWFEQLPEGHPLKKLAQPAAKKQ